MKTALVTMATVSAAASSAVRQSEYPDMNLTPKLGTAELLYRRAAKMGLRPTWVSPGGLFAVTTDDGQQYVNSACSSLNSHVSVSLARNKYLTRLVLERHQLPNIPFARPRSLGDAEVFLATHKKIVVKPVSGSGSHDIHIVEDRARLADIHVSNYIFEKYIPGTELRYLVLNDEVIGVHRSDYGTSVDEHRDLQRISYPVTTWDPVPTALALRITEALGLRFAAVDFMLDNTGRTYILEVNTAPGFKWFHAPTSGPIVDVARLFLEAMLDNSAQTERPVRIAYTL